MNVSVGAKTDPGRRPNNEDQLLVLDVRRHNMRADGVLVIADGMGGRNFGERASSAAVETIGETLVEMLDADRDPGVDVGDALDSALRKANARVYELSGSDEESRGMGTTCVAAVVENDRVYVAHAGDSRAYRWRKGQLTRLTDDHSYVAEQVRAGVLSEENARRSRFRNVITRAVGIEPTITPDVSDHDLQTGDVLLLCTDGLTNMVGEDEIAQTIGQAATAQAAADRLVHMANVNGGRDNITAIIARMEVGTRTQRMRANDLAQIVQPSSTEALSAEEARNGTWQAVSAAAAEDETPTVQPERGSRQARGEREEPIPLAEPPEYDDFPPQRQKRGRAGVLGVSLLGLIAALLLAATLYSGSLLTRAGYRLQASPPFAVKPTPPPPPKPPDLTAVGYGAPVPVSAVPPVSGDTLTHSAANGSLTVVSLTGNILVLTPTGQMLYRYPLPKRHLSAPGVAGATPATAAAVPPSSASLTQRLHTAQDPQGDLYVSDTALHSIEKYKPNGEFLRFIAQGQLKQPQALAVGDDGTVYVIDTQRLVTIPAKPAPLK